MKKPILSIVTVTKDCKDTIERTLQSVKLIKSDDVEYIIIDGVSGDGTIEIIREYYNIVDKMVVEVDSGVYNAMNKGVKLASGKFILFLNGDDEICSHNFSRILTRLSIVEDILVAQCLVLSIDGRVNILSGLPWRLLFFNSLPHPSSFVSKNILLKFPLREDLRIASDYDLFLKLYLKGYKFDLIDQVTATHRRGGLSSDKNLSEKEILLIRNAQLGYFRYFLDFLHRIYRLVLFR